VGSNSSDQVASPASQHKYGGEEHRPFQQSPFGRIAKSHIGSRYIPTKSQVLAQHHENVFCGQFSATGELYMSACQDRRIRLYDTSDWQLKKTIVARDVGWSVLSVDYSPDEAWVIYSSWSENVHLANTKGEHEVHEALPMIPSVCFLRLSVLWDHACDTVADYGTC
jgi:WD repeat-containing protein 23